jgi:N-methylhydantoinase A
MKFPTYPNAEYEVQKAIKMKRKVFFDGQFIDTSVFDYDKLMPNHKIEGPSVIEMAHACCVVTPNWDVTVDVYRNLVLKKVR